MLEEKAQRSIAWKPSFPFAYTLYTFDSIIMSECWTTRKTLTHLRLKLTSWFCIAIHRLRRQSIRTKLRYRRRWWNRWLLWRRKSRQSLWSRPFQCKICSSTCHNPSNQIRQSIQPRRRLQNRWRRTRPNLPRSRSAQHFQTRHQCVVYCGRWNRDNGSEAMAG